MNEAFYPCVHEKYLTTVEQTLNDFTKCLVKMVSDATFIGQCPMYDVWSHKQLRRSQLGENVRVVAAYASGPRQYDKRRASVCTDVPSTVWKRSLMKLPCLNNFTRPHGASSFRRHLYSSGEPLTPTQVNKDLGITRQHLYDHVTADQLHLIFVYGKMRLCVPKGSDTEAALYAQN